MEIDTSNKVSIGRVHSKHRDEIAIDLSNFTDLARVFVQFEGDLDVQLNIYDIVLKSFGYPLPIKRKKQVSEVERISILKRVQHDCLETDKCYRILQKEQEQTTRCKSVRLSTGFYEYTDTEAGIVLDAHEYKLRYHTSLQSNSHRHSFPLYKAYAPNRIQNKRNNVEEMTESHENVSPRKHVRCYTVIEKSCTESLSENSLKMEVDSETPMQIVP